MQNIRSTPRNLVQWNKFLNAPEGDAAAPSRVRKVTAQHLDDIQKLLSEHEKRWGWAKNWKVPMLLSILVTPGISVLLFYPFGADPVDAGKLLHGTVLVLLWTWVACVWSLPVVQGLLGHPVYWVRHNIQPLSEVNGACEQALGLVEKYPMCRTYRDDVMAQGRALMVADLNMLELLASPAQKEEAAEMHKRFCRELHGVST